MLITVLTKNPKTLDHNEGSTTDITSSLTSSRINPVANSVSQTCNPQALALSENPKL